MRRQGPKVRKFYSLARISVRKKPSFVARGPSGVVREGRLQFIAENSILMT